MGTLTSTAIVASASAELLDPTFVRWAQADLLGFLNAGVRAICGYKPDAYVVTSSITIITGAKQTLPAGAIALREVRRNMGAGGATPGAAVTQVERDDMDHARPDWQATIGSAVKHYVHNPDEPKVFYIYPQVASGSVEAAYSAQPTDMTLGQTLGLDDLYEAPLVHYVVGRALQKSSKSGDIARANWHASQFAQFIGIKHQGQFQFAQASPQREQVKQKA